MKTINFQSYAIALFDIAQDKQIQKKYFNQVEQLDKLNTTYSNFAKVLSTITIDKQDRKDLVMELLSELKYDKLFIYWVWSIIDNNDYDSYHYILKECRKLHNFLFNVTRVKVVTASELNENQINKIRDFFQNKINTQIDLDVYVEPNLIGGLKIQVNNKTYNNTIKNKLKNLKQQLLSRKG